jgi:hypothetical protein
VGRHPPVVHQRIERLQRLDLVPPQRRHVQGIARFEFRDQRIRQRFAQAWMPLEIGLVWTRQGERSPGRSEIQRSDVQIGHLVGREKSEAPTSACDDRRKIVRRVEMRGGGDPVACPQSRLRRHRQAGHRMRGEEARQAFGHKRALQGESRDRAVRAAVGGQPLQGLGHADLEVLIVETVQRRVVADHAFGFRRHPQYVHRRAIVERGDRLRELAERPFRRLHQRPVAAQPADEQRLARRDQRIGQGEIAWVIGEFGDGRAHAMADVVAWCVRSVREARWKPKSRRARAGSVTVIAGIGAWHQRYFDPGMNL